MQDTVDTALKAPGMKRWQGDVLPNWFLSATTVLPRLRGLNHRADEGGLWVNAGRVRLAHGEINAYANGQREQPATAPDEGPKPMRAEVALNMESGSWIVGHNLTPDQARELAYVLLRAAQEVDNWVSEVRP